MEDVVVRTLCLNAKISSSVRVSALAMTGMRFTLVCNRRITSMSKGFSEWPVGWMKYTQACTRLSTMLTLLTLFSASRYASNRRSTSSTIGRQESSLLTKSPKPGVSTTVRRRRTPFSSISALIDWIETVFGIMSRLGPFRSLGGYRDVLKRVLTRVDFPRPDSPSIIVRISELYNF